MRRKKPFCFNIKRWKKKTKKENYFSHIIKLFIRKRDVNVDIFQKHDLLGEKKMSMKYWGSTISPLALQVIRGVLVTGVMG